MATIEIVGLPRIPGARMKYPIFRCLGIALAAALAQPAGAQQLTPVQRTAIDSTLDRLFGLGLAPGMGIAVVRDTQVIYLKGLGYADAEARRPFTPQTVFYVASTTKSFTGLAAAMLDLQGKFRLDAPLSRYLPQARLKPPRHADSITIRQLLSHSHGIAGGPVEMRLAYTGEYQGNEQLVSLLAEHNALPDQGYGYSTRGYKAAAIGLGPAPGEAGKEPRRGLTFRPLGMKGTARSSPRFQPSGSPCPTGAHRRDTPAFA